VEFTSNEERPHQPVRIYRKHVGRCGENGDLRVASARLALIPAASVASYSTDHYGVTDNEGKVTFLVGPDRTYWTSMSCEYGNVPSQAGEVMRVLGNSQSGEKYSKYMKIQAAKPTLNWQEIVVPRFQNTRYFLQLDFKAPSQILRGRDLFDDMEVTAYQFIETAGGRTNFFMLDETNYQHYISGQEFAGFHSVYQSDSSTTGFEFDDTSDWYCVFDNTGSLHTLQHIKEFNTIF